MDSAQREAFAAARIREEVLRKFRYFPLTYQPGPYDYFLHLHAHGHWTEQLSLSYQAALSKQIAAFEAERYGRRCEDELRAANDEVAAAQREYDEAVAAAAAQREYEDAVCKYGPDFQIRINEIKVQMFWERLRRERAQQDRQSPWGRSEQQRLEREEEDRRRWAQEGQRRRQEEEQQRKRQCEERQRGQSQGQPFNQSSFGAGQGNMNIDRWRRDLEAAFVDLSSMMTFPAPPSRGFCSNAACLAGKNNRLLNACPCDIRHAFTQLGRPLKKERVRWHPDRFSRCDEAHREIF